MIVPSRNGLRQTRKGTQLCFTLVLGLTLTLVLIDAQGLAASEATAEANAHPLLGQPFVIGTDTAALTRPAVAYNSNRQQFLIAYERDDGFFQLQLHAKDGSSVWPAGYLVLIAGKEPDIAYDPVRDKYLLVWQDEDHQGRYDIRGAHLSHDGFTIIGTLFDIANGSWHQQKPAVAFNNHVNHQDYLVVWEDIDPTWVPQEIEVWAQRLAGTFDGGDLGGPLIDGNFTVAADASWNFEPDVAYNLNMNEYLVVYTKEPSGGGAKDVYGSRVTRDGVLVGGEKPIDTSANDQHQPAVAAYRLNQNTPYLVLFTDFWNDSAGDVRGYLVNKEADSTLLVNVATIAGVQETAPDVTSSEALGGYTAVWAQLETDWNVWGRRLSNTGEGQPAFNASVAEGMLIVGANEENPAVAGGWPTALAVWQGAHGGANWSISGRVLGYGVYLPLMR